MYWLWIQLHLCMALSGRQHQQSVAIHVWFVEVDFGWSAARHFPDLRHQLLHGLLHSKQRATFAGTEDVNLIDLPYDLKLHEEPQTEINEETHHHAPKDNPMICNLHLEIIPRISFCYHTTNNQWHGNNFQQEPKLEPLGNSPGGLALVRWIHEEENVHLPEEGQQPSTIERRFWMFMR